MGSTSPRFVLRSRTTGRIAGRASGPRRGHLGGWLGVLAATVSLGLSATILAGGEVDELVRALRSDARSDAEAAGKILRAATELQDDPAVRVQLYEKAYEIGLRHRDGYGAAIRAASVLVKLDRANRAAWQKKLLAACRLDVQAASRKDKPGKGQTLLRYLVALADRAASRGDWTEAVTLYGEALATGRHYDPARQGELTAKLAKARSQAVTVRQAQQLRKRLEEAPAEIATREKLILLYVVGLDDPAEASKLLTPETREELRTYVPMAARDVAKIQPGSCLELGDWYKALASKAVGPANKAKALRRAKTYYERFLSRTEDKGVRRYKAKASLGYVTRELGISRAATGLPAAMARDCVLYLPFDRETFVKRKGKSFARDLSGQGNDGVVVGAKYVGGKVHGALAFDGVNAYVALPKGRLSLKSPLSLSVWARREGSARVFGSVYSKEEVAGYGLSHNDKGYWYFTVYTAGAYRSAGDKARAEPGRWYHLVGVWDGQSTRIYVDGKLKGHTPTPPRPRSAPYGAMIGANPGRRPEKHFKGIIDEVAVFARALSAEEARLLFDLGTRAQTLIRP